MSEPNAITQVLDLFDREGVESVLVGGAAVILHGSAYVTEDVDVCCRRDPDNMVRIARAINAVAPRLRVEGIVEGVPTRVDVHTLRADEAFAFITTIGNIDIRFSIDGIGDYAKVATLSEAARIGDRTFQVLSLSGIIQSKSFLRRPRDLQVLPELEMMREAKAIRESAEPGRDAAPEETGLQPPNRDSQNDGGTGNQHRQRRRPRR